MVARMGLLLLVTIGASQLALDWLGDWIHAPEEPDENDNEGSVQSNKNKNGENEQENDIVGAEAQHI